MIVLKILKHGKLRWRSRRCCIIINWHGWITCIYRVLLVTSIQINRRSYLGTHKVVCRSQELRRCGTSFGICICCRIHSGLHRQCRTILQYHKRRKNFLMMRLQIHFLISCFKWINDPSKIIRR